jgi:hypothetical protein
VVVGIEHRGRRAGACRTREALSAPSLRTASAKPVFWSIASTPLRPWYFVKPFSSTTFIRAMLSPAKNRDFSTVWRYPGTSLASGCCAYEDGSDANSAMVRHAVRLNIDWLLFMEAPTRLVLP